MDTGKEVNPGPGQQRLQRGLEAGDRGRVGQLEGLRGLGVEGMRENLGPHL